MQPWLSFTERCLQLCRLLLLHTPLGTALAALMQWMWEGRKQRERVQQQQQESCLMEMTCISRTVQGGRGWEQAAMEAAAQWQR